MTLRNSTRQSEGSSTQIQTKKNISLYLVIILSIAFNSLAVLTLSEYFLGKKVAKIAQVIEPQQRDIGDRLSPTSNARQENNFPSKYFIYLLSAIVAGTPTYIYLVFLVKKLARLKENTTTIDATIVGDADSQPDILASAQKDNSATKENQTLGYNPYVLLANLSHELRSPLNAILGFAQIMEQELASDGVAKANIAIVNRSGERLLSIVNDVVDLAKIETERFILEQNHIDFYSWLDHIEQNFNSANKNWQFSIVKQKDLPQYICLDERRLRQILTNIINYCLEKPSKVDISLRVTASEPLKLAKTDSQNSCKHNINFEVENANFSATAEELATVFDPIVRARQESKSTSTSGSSLNLPISRRLAQSMGGDLTISRSGLGIIFNLEIQAKSTIAQKSKIQSSLRRVVGLESDRVEHRILIVDDSKTNRKIMSSLLEPVGFTIREAVNGKEAVDIWFEWQPHMIWMDLRMPVMNGYEATELIKSHSQYTPIVALSATTLEEEKLRFKAAGCDDFVSKPFVENVIFDKIAQHLGIRYIYEPIPAVENSFKPLENTLEMMPGEWWRQLESAALMLDRDALTQLLQQIPLEHLQLRQTLQQQIDNFDFDEILSFIENAKG